MAPPRLAQVTAIARHELRGLRRDGRVRIATTTVALLVGAAIVTGALHAQRTTRERQTAGAIERDRWIGQPAKNSHDATHYGVYVFKPPSPLSLVDRGIESFVGIGLWLEAHRTNMLRHRPIEDATAVNRFGELTAALSLQVLAPLLLIVAGHATFAGERERGLLRQALASGATRVGLAVGKIGALAIAATIVAVPTVGLGAALLVWTQPGPVESVRVVAMLAAYAAYLLGWLLLVAAVSARARSSRAALVILVALWFTSAVLGPRVAGDLAASVHPVPTPIAFRTAIEHDIGPHSPERIAERRTRILREYGVARTDDLPIDWRGISLQEEEERTSAIFERHITALHDVYRAQNGFLQAAGFVMPILAVQAISQAAAASDFEHEARFLAAAEDHRRVIQRLMNADVTANDREGTTYKADPRLWSTVPPFDPLMPPFSTMLPSAQFAILALVVWVGGTAVAYVWAVRGLRP